MTNRADLIAKTILKHLRGSGELKLLPQIVEAIKLSSEYKNTLNRVIITSPYKLGAREEKQLKAYVSRSVVGDFELKNILDPSLVGGFTLQINDTLIDASLLGKINSIQNQLTTKD